MHECTFAHLWICGDGQESMPMPDTQLHKPANPQMHTPESEAQTDEVERFHVHTDNFQFGLKIWYEHL